MVVLYSKDEKTLKFCKYVFIRSTFAVDGSDCTVNKEVERVLKDFHKAGKPIG